MYNIVRHKCFISYNRADSEEVEQFIRDFGIRGQCFIHRAVTEMEQNIIDSNDKNYVMRRIRDEYLSDSTVTIVMIGRCTWARRYVDWEIASTLRNDPNNRRSGLMAILLPSANSEPYPALPPRLRDNCEKEEKYARYYYYPTSVEQLTAWIEDAFQARDIRADLIDNTRELAKSNRQCP